MYKQIQTVQRLEQIQHFTPFQISQSEILELIVQYITESLNTDIFSDIIDYRVKEVASSGLDDESTGNLGYMLNCAQALDNVQHKPMIGVPEVYNIIEKIAVVFFGGILPCWTEYQIFTRTNKTRSESGQNSPAGTRPALSIDVGMGYYAELITDISAEHRTFLTSFTDRPLSLADANVLINLETFVKQQCWYEMLYDMELSAAGEHIILYQVSEQGQAMLFASARIQRWAQRDKWLAFDPFFQSDKWILSVTGEKIRSLEQSGVFVEGLKDKVSISTPANLDRSLSQSVASEGAMCELIRLAVSGPTERMSQILFLTTKYLTLLLKSAKLELVYIITEQPAILFFFHSANQVSTNGKPYIPLSHHQVNKSSPVTHKGFFISSKIADMLENCSFKDYYKIILKARKQTKKGMEITHA